MSQNGSVPGENGRDAQQPHQPPQNFGNQPGGNQPGGWPPPTPPQQPGGQPFTGATPPVQAGWGQPPTGQPPTGQPPAGQPPTGAQLTGGTYSAPQPSWGQQTPGQQQPGWGQQEPGQHPRGPGGTQPLPAAGWQQGSVPLAGTQQGNAYGGPPPGSAGYGTPPYPPAGSSAPYAGAPSADQGWTQPGQQPSTGWSQPLMGAQQPPAGWTSQPGASGQPPWSYPPSGQGGPNQPRRSNKAVLGVVGGVVGVALIGGTALVVQRANTTTPTPQPTVSASNAPTVPAAPKPSDLVTAYLKALGSGDSKAALSMAAVAPTDTTMLTDKVLAKTTVGKLSDVSVPEVSDENATRVSASYSLNGKPVSTTFAVTKVAGVLRLERVSADVDVSAVSNVAVTLAGQRPGSDVVSLFPGVYPVASVNKYYAVATKALTVSDLQDLTPSTRNATLSSSGKSAIVKAVSAKYAWCLKQNSLKPAGCALWVRRPSGVTLRMSTVSYSTTSGANWSKAKPKLLTVGVVEAVARTKVRFNVRDTTGRLWYVTLPIVGYRALLGNGRVTVSFY